MVKYIERLEKEARAIKTETLKLCWFMRGGVTISEAMQMSWSDRDIVNGIIKENLDTTKKSGLPFF